MEVKRVVPSGYCKGVVNAIKLAKQTRAENPDEKIYILGMLVHNSFVSDELASLGIITLDDSVAGKEELLDKVDEGIIIFTAHGISDRIKNKAAAKGLKYVDATCVDVLKITSARRSIRKPKRSFPYLTGSIWSRMKRISKLWI